MWHGPAWVLCAYTIVRLRVCWCWWQLGVPFFAVAQPVCPACFFETSSFHILLPLHRIALQLVGGDRVQWPAGQAGERTFTLKMASAPMAGRIRARLVDAEGGAVVPAAGAMTEVVALSPVLSFEPSQQVC